MSKDCDLQTLTSSPAVGPADHFREFVSRSHAILLYFYLDLPFTIEKGFYSSGELLSAITLFVLNKTAISCLHFIIIQKTSILYTIHIYFHLTFTVIGKVKVTCLNNKEVVKIDIFYSLITHYFATYQKHIVNIN